MIVDTSAICAILFREPDRGSFVALLGQSERLAMSAGSWVELGVVLSHRGDQPALEADALRLMKRLDVIIEPVSVIQADLAREAYRRYGRGSGHPAKLNFGDCFAYALARETGRPLLFKGDDFRHTDVVPAS